MARGPAAATSLVTAGPDELLRRAEDSWAGDRRNAVLGFVGPEPGLLGDLGGDRLRRRGLRHANFPWPLIVMAVTLAHLVRVLVTREDTIRDEVVRLQRKQAKELERRDRRGRRGRRDDRPEGS